MCEQAQPEEHGPAEFAESQLEKPRALRSVSDVQGDEMSLTPNARNAPARPSPGAVML